jgi:Fic family protein
MNETRLLMLPPNVNLETVPVLKQLAKSNRALAELKGYADTIPNKNILLNAVMINEAKDSSEIENIITTHDELYKALSQSSGASLEAKEVVNYRSAIWEGYQLVLKEGILTVNMIVRIQGIVEGNHAGIRKLPGTVLINSKTSEVIYTPPSDEREIRNLLSNLENYINEEDDRVDPLIKLAVIHFQFESIHPFYDGNGRTGRIINIIYLILKDLINSPILYLSRYINKNKSEYYRLLQEVHTQQNWGEWILFMLKGIEETAKDTLELVKRINVEIDLMRNEIKTKLPKIYSKELIDLLFFEFYTKTIYIEKGLSITRKTAVSYLSALEMAGFLVSEKIGKERIYKNKRLYDLVKFN